MSRRRSVRSIRTPPGSANSSHGSQATANAADTTSGSDVADATSRGAATVTSPLASADAVDDTHRSAKAFRDRTSGTGGT